MEIRSLAHTDFDTLYEAFAAAFADYEIHPGREELRKMLRRRGFVPELSYAAFDGDRIAAFTFNGIGLRDGLPTAYDTGTGTLPAYRGQGLASRIFTDSIPHLRAAKIARYLLEVLRHNPAALAVYRKMGFETTREFHYFRQEKRLVTRPSKSPAFPSTIRPLDPVAACRMSEFRDFRPSWQNDDDSIVRAGSDLLGFGLYRDDRPLGYCICEPATGDIAQLAVDPRYRRQGIASALLRHALDAIEAETIKIINTETAYEPLARFLRTLNIPLAGNQYEMMREL
ncbi:MAG: GNAT family N-acetyltransferase [Alistipes sp.]|nr:GNAT family N-acetyltransferase [Alistipes senegalensis]MCM1249535.1 GNAT family N-acetyltransferase [Alistipes sp.]